MSNGHLTRRGLTLAAIGLATPGLAHAEAAWPNHPLRLLVPVAPGGLTDLLGRTVAAKLEHILGQPVITENRGGASMIIGTQAAARASPDGYTLLIGSASSLVLNGLLRRQLPYNPQTDFTLLSVLVEVPFVLVVNPRLGINSLAEFIAYARAEPGRTTYGSAGVGTSTHLPGEMLGMMAEVELTHVPYAGNAPALTAVLSGDVTAVFDTVITSLPHLREGRLRALAVTTADRVAALPDVPTIAESGYPGYETASWIGVAAPAGLPAPVEARLRDALRQVLEDPQFRSRFAELGMVMQPTRDAATTARYFAADRARWAEVIGRRGLVLD
ncbi:tripartite-type tricarboxylate transporter receptor subunit TctC [Humitalea rosea]|uniref:Tripartite-type tricarboxylate transporter receptor subunit TctC n=1 Tax=Humitalea rosea TaxID=990373 RepID=A0A2W7II46_9PROT|nr:tripartite tricarboxylate transporter substrate binding protein [Humitalea rosea]PZW44815.1 tripartite-type tricarboxylate transporter receptor subunit TctC [Humitalea rosea]